MTQEPDYSECWECAYTLLCYSDHRIPYVCVVCSRRLLSSNGRGVYKQRCTKYKITTEMRRYYFQEIGKAYGALSMASGLAGVPWLLEPQMTLITCHHCEKDRRALRAALLQQGVI
jgi:ribosomal protein S27E